jgi:hypothetical protein
LNALESRKTRNGTQQLPIALCYYSAVSLIPRVYAHAQIKRKIPIQKGAIQFIYIFILAKHALAQSCVARGNLRARALLFSSRSRRAIYINYGIVPAIMMTNLSRLCALQNNAPPIKVREPLRRQPSSSNSDGEKSRESAQRTIDT